MTHLAGIVPAEYAAGHILVLPWAEDPVAVRPMASAWFADVAWLREPARGSGTRKMTGARFRGMPQTASVTPGVLRLGEEHVGTGPFTVDGDQLTQVGITGEQAEAYAVTRNDGLRDVRASAPTSYDDRDGIARSFPAALPQGAELRLVQWAVAVGRKVGGVVLGDGHRPMVPDPHSSVNLSLFSAHPLAPGDVLAILRGFIATAEVRADQPAPDGSPRYQVVGATAYDGSIVVDVERVDSVPRTLVELDWRAYGPFAYRVSWIPVEPHELDLERPSGLHVIARSRIRATIARIASVFRSRIAGVVVDGDGFVVAERELGARSDPHVNDGGGRVWV